MGVNDITSKQVLQEISDTLCFILFYFVMYINFYEHGTELF